MLSTELMKQQVIPLFFSSKGRISRGLFWKSNLVLWLDLLSFVFCLVAAEQLAGFSNDLSVKIIMVAIIVYGYSVTVLTIKRLHDINWSGWWVVPCIVVGFFLWFIVGIVPSKEGVNIYGDNLIEYEKNRLIVNRGAGLPPPAPPLDNFISKIVLYLMMILPIPSLIAAGIVAPNKINTPTEQTEKITLDEAQTASLAESKDEELPFELRRGDEYQKVEASDGIEAYYIVTRADGIVEHYSLDGTLQWSNMEHEKESFETDTQSSTSVFSACPNQSKTIFNCTTTNNKVIQVCDAGNTISYVFGKENSTPELAITVSRNKVTTYQWQGIGRYENYAINIPNGKTIYRVNDSLDKMTQQYTAGIEVSNNDKLLATVECDTNKKVTSKLQGIELRSEM